MIDIKIGEHTFHLPTGWNDITVGQLIMINKNKDKILKDNILMLAIVCTRHDSEGKFPIGDIKTKGTPYHAFTYGNSFEIETQLIPKLQFLARQINFEEQPMYDYIGSREAGGNRWHVLRDLKKATYGQKILAGQLMERTQLRDEMLPELLALFLTNDIYTAFDAGQYEKHIPAMLNLPAVQAYPVYSFFVRTLLGLPMSGVVDASSLKQAITKRQMEDRLSSSENTAWFITWLKATYFKWTAFWQSRLKK